MQNTDLLKHIGMPLKVRTVLSKIDIAIPDEDLNRSLFFHGDAGTGKTIQAAAILATALFKRIHIPAMHNMLDPTNAAYIGDEQTPQFARWYVFVRVPDMLSRIKRTFDPSSNEKEGDLIDLYSRARLLVLDDLGAELTTDWAYLMLYLIVDNRYNEMLPTIFTSNYSLKQIRSSLNDERLISRIYEMCDKDGIRKISGENYRMSAQTNTVLSNKGYKNR